MENYYIKNDNKKLKAGLKRGLRLKVLRVAVVLGMMMGWGVSEAWGVTVTYHIINLGRLDDNGLTSTRTEALQFTSTSTTVGLPDKYKSPLAKNWQYYSSSDVTYNSSTKVCVFNSGPSLYDGYEVSDDAHVYVTYELDEDRISDVGLYNGGVCRVKFPNDYYLQQSYWMNGNIKELNTTSSIENTNTSPFWWKFNIIDPYQITVQSQSQSDDNCFDYYLSSKNGGFGDIRLKETLSEAKNNKVWAFGLLNGGTDGTYRLVVTDGFINTPTGSNQLDSYGHGYLNNRRENYKTTYQLYNKTNYYSCDLTFEPLTKTYIILNSSGETLVQATTTDYPLEVPDVIKSPFATYSYYSDAACTHEISAVGNTTTIYVRYTTISSSLNLNGGENYFVRTNGNYWYAENATSIGIEGSIANPTNDTKWTLNGDDAYQLTIKNVGQNKEVTYDVSSGEAVPTLSATGSKFFLHQSNTGRYEVVAVTSGDYSTAGYYSMGVANNTLKLYSNSNYPLGQNEVQSVFSTQTACVKPVITFDYTTSEVTLTSATTGATLYYTTVGGTPDQLYDPNNKPTLTATTTVRAMAVKSGFDNSDVEERTIEQLDAPSVTFDDASQSVVITTNGTVVGVATVYTDDGSDPTTSSTAYTAPIFLDATTTVKARTVKADYVNSTITPLTVTKLGDPTITADSEAHSFTITNASVDGVSFYYTTNGDEPNLHQVGPSYPTQLYNNTPVVLDNGVYTVKVISTKSGYVNSEIYSASVDLRTIPHDPTLVTENCDNSVELVCDNVPNAQIYYTTDGSTPSNEHGTLFEEAFTPSVGATIRAIAYNNGLASGVATFTYEITHTAPPTITMTNSTTITIAGPEGSTIYYTTNQVDPTIGGTNVTYGPSPLNVPYNGIDVIEFRAMAVLSPLDPSCVTKVVTIGAPTITISEDDCSTASPRGNVLSISFSRDEATLWYAITPGNNSTAPNPNATPNPYSQYTAPVTLDDLDGNNTHYTIHAYAKSSDGFFNSLVTSQSHEMKTAGKPSLAPPSGSSPVMTISGGVFLDFAKCTTDMGTPEDPSDDRTETVRIVSDGTAQFGIPAEWVGTIHVAFKHINWLPSCDSTYIIPQAPDTPTWSQGCDNKLSLHTNSSMAVIHYTINGEEPSLSSSTYTEGCLYNIADGTRVRAKAFQGFLFSAELDFVYHPAHVDAPQFFVNGTTVRMTSPAGTRIRYTYSVGTALQPVPSDPLDPNDPDATPVETVDNSVEVNIQAGDIITIFKAIAFLPGDNPQQEASCVVRVETREGYSINVASDLDKLNAHPDSYFFVMNDIDAGDYPTQTVNEFTGVLDGKYHTISNLKKPLFKIINSVNAEHNAAVLNLMLKQVTISTSSHAGAIATVAKGYTRIYNCGILPDAADGTTTSSISGGSDDKVGGLVGAIDETARVINCFSYANIGSGKYRGGIVGYNYGTSNQTSVTTMVMNCMFYGNISTEGTFSQIAPIYGKTKISNSGSTGLNNYNYFRFNSPYVSSGATLTYNCALGAQDRFLERFEFYRNILNSNRELAMWYVSASVENAATEMGHWVLDKSVAPYPILKEPGQAYPSIINPDAAHAIPIDPDNEHRNEGRKLGELTVNISGVGSNAPSGATISSSSLTLNIIDKDEANYNFNYKKIQLPYYHEVGTNNYTGNKVVTGWKITSFVGGTPGSFTTGNDVVFDGQGNISSTPYNFVDRACTDKDKYSVSGRVFNQGAYYEVPDGVTAITIEPYWANCVYLSDSIYDVTYDNTTAYPVTLMGKQPSTIASNTDNNTIYHEISDAHAALFTTAPPANATVYDYAIVLVGNYHKSFGTGNLINDSKPFTIMSADMDNDNEPDNSFFYHHDDRKGVSPIRFDFINVPGIGMAQKQDGSKGDFQPGIFQPRGWFEITNTVLIYFGQFEYSDGNNMKIDAPVILQGGIYEQFVSARKNKVSNHLQYLLIGGNSWFKNCAFGCHSSGTLQTKKVPVSVAGGDYEHFYLTGIYSANINPDDENVECYIDGGRFGEVAGAGQQRVDGSVTWVINAADITSFFGGGINYNSIVSDKIYTQISDSHVNEFCGGPKFGYMNNGKTVTTIATNCDINTFFGAGYGGTALNRIGIKDYTYSGVDFSGWNGWVNDYYFRKYQTSQSIDINGQPPTVDVNAVSTSYEYEYMFYSGGTGVKKVARFYVNFASLSLANTKNVSSTLNGCRLGNFYGGGKLGAVEGDVVSTLTDCKVEGDVYGSGYSADVSTVDVISREKGNGSLEIGFRVRPEYNNTANTFNNELVQYGDTVTYTWTDDASLFTLTGENPQYFYDNGDTHLIYTSQPLNNLGAVLGNATLTINGNSVVKGNVYGGGALSSSGTGATGGRAQVNINGGTYGVVENNVVSGGNIFGGGKGDSESLGEGHNDRPVTEDIVEVNIGNASQDANNVVIYGSVYGCNNVNGSPTNNATVHIYKTKHDENNIVTNMTGGYAIKEVFGGGNQAHYQPTTADKKATVHVHNCDNTIEYIYGGGNAADVGTSAVNSATDVIIDGGRHKWVFGGGNGYSATNNHTNPNEPNYNPGANIFGNTSVTFHAGDITYLFGGSNEWGTVSGDRSVSLLNDETCSIPNHIAEFYGGNNKAPIESGYTLNMPCTPGSDPCPIDYLFGGSRMADISGNVELNVYGGLYNYVFGGNNLSGTIGGNVTLNLYGGTINEAAFGGNNQGGSINGKLTVNMLDQGDCPLVVHNIYGGGNEAAYTPTYTLPEGTTQRIVPEVNLIHGTVSKKSDGTGGNVYGGGLGSSATVEANPIVNVGYDVSMATLVGTLLPSGTSLTTANVTVAGNVFGGGEAANVAGSTVVIIQKVASSTGVSATTTVGGDVYGGGALADVNVTNNALTSGATTTVTLDGGTVGNIYGGGLGQKNGVNGATSDIAAKVYGPVQVTVNGGTVTGSVYGCNNLNGAPQSTVKVDIYGTDPASGSSYALGHVFGGGNMAAYGGTPIVTIHGCSNSIEYVYGGGNAASVDSTDVTVWGGTIGYVFGGGNGTGVTPTYEMVTKGVKTLIYGGTIGKVFGTNNSNGTVGGNKILVYIHKKPEDQRIGCDMKIGEVYGGGNLANGKAGIIDIRCTGTLVPLGLGERYGYEQEGIGTVYGGANQADISNDIDLRIKSGIIQNVFGGNNNSGLISGSITVTIKKFEEASCASQWYVGDVFGGGNHAHYIGTPDVNIVNGTVSGSVYGGGNDITDGTLGVTNSDVVMVGGTVLGGVYGGCNVNGTVTGNSEVTIMGGTIGSNDLLNAATPVTTDVFGGGLGENTKVDGNVTVTITKASGNTVAAPTIYGNVYGGSALGQVNNATSNSTPYTTTVEILDGTLVSKSSTDPNNSDIVFYTGGNVFGGGLGESGNANKGKVNGKVIVNIGKGTPDVNNPFGVVVPANTLVGNATIGGNVYGCNNSGGSPQDDVVVNVFQTAHTPNDSASYNNAANIPDVLEYAIANVFGGGNEANFSPAETGKTANVNIYTCDNSIRRVFGGGNAASTPEVVTHIQGGRLFQVFGGGNGERGENFGADIHGDVTLNLHGGNIGEYYGGSNQNGVISGNITTNVLNDGPCESVIIDDFFCGGNFVDIYGDLITNIPCSDGHIKNLYGGCNQATIYGNVVLNLCGGNYENVFGGSKGKAAINGVGGISADILHYTSEYIEEHPGLTDEGGNVTLNLYGGTIENVFGGSNINGNIEGNIIVNVLDSLNISCPLYITNIYGGSNLTDYVPDSVNQVAISDPNRISPVVNLVHAKYGIAGNVYGASKGNPNASTATKVMANPLVNIGYDDSMDVYIPSTYSNWSTVLSAPRAIVAGSVFGGGDAAKVVGNTAIFLRNRAKVFGNVYGGGNMGEVTGDTKVIVNGANQ